MLSASLQDLECVAQSIGGTLKFTFTSLFAGGGGLDLGFMQAGFMPRAAFDIDPVAISSYEKNVGRHISLADISNPDTNLARAASVADVLVAGPPCQGFSTAGHNNPNDDRNKLLLRTVDIVCECKPPIAVIENVRGLMGSGFRAYTDELNRRLALSGYTTRTLLLNASEHGVAQERKRVFIVASRIGNISFDFDRQPAISLRRALDRIPPAELESAINLSSGSREYKIAQAILPGQKLTNVRSGESCVHTWNVADVFGRTSRIERETLQGLLVARRTQRLRDNGDADPVTASRLTRELGFPTASILRNLVAKGFVRKVGAAYDLTHSFNGKYRRLAWDKPAPTVDTRFGQPRYFLHPEENRGFSVRETARLQGFPDSYVFPRLSKDAFRLIGNAVPPPLAKAVAVQLRNALKSYDSV